MKENTEEKDIADIVYCRGFKKHVTIETCTSGKCEYFGGLHKEAIKQRVEGKKDLQKTGEIVYVKCCLPRLEPVNKLCEV